MMKLWSQCFPDKSVRSKKSNPPDANVESVESNSKDDPLDNQIKLNDLPLEILYLIIEKLDKEHLFYCFFVCRKWRSIVFSIAHTEKVNTT